MIFTLPYHLSKTYITWLNMPGGLASEVGEEEMEEEEEYNKESS